MIKDELGDRIKANYENRAKTYLLRRTPCIVRIDGRAFHTLTKKFVKPFDIVFGMAMQQTMKSLCENISGCVLGYTQSDEITLVLVDYQTLQTDAFFDYAVQKISSVCAGMATMYFNKHFQKLVWKQFELGQDISIYEDKNGEILMGSFDARCFNVPKEEVVNTLIWRQNDASKNSIQMLARSLFTHKSLQGLSNSKLQDKMMLEKNVNWNDLEVWKKRGSCCIRGEDRKWFIDRAIPIFTENKAYIEDLVYLKDKSNE